MASVFNLLMKRIKLEVFTPDNHLTPILRYGMYNRLVPPGYNRINPLLEEQLPAFKTSIRVAKLKFDELLSADGIPFTIQLTVLYKFDPRKSPANVIAQFARVPARVLEDIVADYTAQGLRRLIARHMAQSVFLSSTISDVERDLCRFLNAEMRILGISLPSSGSVIIRETVPSERYKRTMLEANLHQVTMNVLSKFKDQQLIPLSLYAELVANLEHVDGNVVMTPDMETAVFGKMLSTNGKETTPQNKLGPLNTKNSPSNSSKQLES
ncbi:MAG: hypothetical protein GY943_18930 [Chloroflexi bacterium]|nr:hypothetical protein [Chloroflexota bacterium]